MSLEWPLVQTLPAPLDPEKSCGSISAVSCGIGIPKEPLNGDSVDPAAQSAFPSNHLVSRTTLRLAVEDHKIIGAPGIGPRVLHLRAVIFTGVAHDELIRLLPTLVANDGVEVISGGRVRPRESGEQ